MAETASIVGFRLSPQQERLWLLGAGNLSLYRTRCAVLVFTEIDESRLRAAIDQVAERSEILRSLFHCVPGMVVPLQVVGDRCLLEITQVDVPGDDPHELEQRALAVFDELGHLSFEPAEGPALRVRLLSQGRSLHALVLAALTLHLDALGMRNLLLEIGRSLSFPPPDPEDGLQYADLAEWQHELMATEDGAGVDFWRAQAGMDLTARSLPWERLAAAADYAPASILFSLEPDLAAAAAAAARQHGVELSDLLLTAWQALLCRLSGSSEVRIGVDCEGRSYDGLEEQLGFFARRLPVDLRWEAEADFGQALRRTRRAVAQARDWQEYFDWSRLNGRESGAPPFVPFAFDFLDAWSSGASAFPWRVLRVGTELDRSTVRLSCLRVDDCLHAELHYDACRIEKKEADLLVERFQCLLRGALRDTRAGLGDLPLVGTVESRWLLDHLNCTAVPTAGSCLHELVAEQALRTPERIAVVAVNGTMSYAELIARSNHLAQRLRCLGVGPEVCVGVWVERSLDLPMALLGILAAGGAYVPLDPSYPRERLRFVLTAAGATVVVAPAERVSDLETEAVRVVSIDTGPVEKRAEPAASGATPDNLAYVLFTSGSTGQPKGVMISHAAITNRLLWMQRALPLGESDVVLQKTPASFDASIWELFVPLLSGARLAMAPPEAHRDSTQLVELVERFGVTILQLVPSQLRLVVEEPALAHCPSLRRVFCGGEALSVELRERFANRLGIELVNLYGPTECSIDATWFHCSAERESDAVSGAIVPIGRPLDNMRVYVLDRWQQPVAAGLAGELCIAGAGLARGYRGRPGATANVFVPDPFGGEPGARMYRTGDLARHLPGGALSFLGRIDHQVKVRGFRIELGEIEAVLASHPEIAEAAVVARELAPGDLQLVAYVVVRQGASHTVAELRSFLAERLPELMLPAFVLPLPFLPRLPSGKIDRAALIAADLPTTNDGDGEEVSATADRNPVEEILAGIFAVLLHRERVAPTESFFDLGGHSLLATQVMTRIRESLRVDLPMRALFDHPTPEGLARELERRLAQDAGRELPPIVSGARDGDLPLSFAQERLWLVQQLFPEGVAYNLPFLVELPRGIDLRLLSQALSLVVTRHEALRTTFPSYEGRPVQRVGPGARDLFPRMDLRALPTPGQRQEIERIATEEARRPFDLARGPLFRTMALLGAEETSVVFTLHHIASDAWSVGILLRELEALYSAIQRSTPSPLEDLPVQYGDYAVWQRSWLQSAAAAAQLEFWRHQLAGAPRLLELPLDRPRSTEMGARGLNRTTLIPFEVAAGLKGFARRRGVTLFMALLAGWKVLLHRFTGQEDLVVGAPTAGRTAAEVERLIGVFINVLALRTALAGSLPVAALLERIRTTALSAFHHQDLPFERLIQELEPERSARHSPIFQVLFALQNAPVGRLRLAGETLDVRPLATGEVQFDLILSVTETAAGMLCQLGYRNELFDHATILRLENQLLAVLAALASDEAERCEDLVPLPASERHQLLREWGNGGVAHGAGGPWATELVAAQAAIQPQARAVVCGAQQLTYDGLMQVASRIAWRLQRCGVGPEVPVGVLLERSPELVAALFGIWMAGGVYVPLEPGLPESRLRLMLEEGRVELVLTDEALVGSLPAATRTLFVSSWESWPADGPAPAAPTSAQSLAYLIFTSGTTGRPKAVMVTHGNLAQVIACVRQRFAFGPGDVMLHLASFGFDISLFELLLPLTSGGCAVALQRDEILDLPLLAAALREATRFHAVPSLMRQLVQHLRTSGERPHRLRTAFTGGDAVPAELLRDMREVLPKSELAVLYGPTEGTIICSSWRVPERDEIAAAVIGRPLPGALLRVVDPSGAPAPIGVAGELCVAGDGVTRGYQGRPDLTADKYRPVADLDGRGGAREYRTGDRARLLADGNIEFLGRIDNQMKIRGYRVEPGDVEAALTEHPGIAEVAVVPRLMSVRGGDLQLVAYLVTRQGCPATEELQSYARAKLPEYMVPGAFVQLATLPRNASGKLDRAALPEPDSTRAGSDRSYIPPRNIREEALAAIWAQVLGVSRVGIHDDFFALGGDSILCIQIIARANQQGFRLTPRDLFRQPTVAALAMASPAEIVSGLVPAQGPVLGTVQLVPIQCRFFAEVLVEPHHFNQALLLSIRPAPTPALVAIALEHLLMRHDVLRMRFEQQGEDWRQVHAELVAGDVFTCIDLASLSPERLSEAIESAAAAVQTSLDLTRGPLLRGVLFLTSAGEPARLLLVVHHLVVDGVSWRILLADLELAWQQLARGEAVRLPAKTTSFKQWAEQLVLLAQSPELHDELEEWLAPSRKRLLPLPVDRRVAIDPVGLEEAVVVSLSTAETQRLLRDAVQPYRTRVDHLLLVALAHAFAAWMRGPALLIDLESHGREEIVPGLDLSSTVGWFTSVYPVLLEVPAAAGWPTLIKATKERLQRVPKQGIGYGLLRYLRTDEVAAALGQQRQAEVSFNYLGQLDRVLAADSPFLPARESAGPARSPRQERSHRIDVTASVAGQRLQVTWAYGAAHRQETVEKLAAGFLDALRGLLEHCLSPEAGGYTPSDFPLAHLDQAALDLLVQPGDEVEDIYPQSPLQQGLFFHALFTPHSGDYIVQRRSTLAGDLDIPALRRAWELLVERHTVLRTSFVSAGLKIPVQRVHRRVSLRWSEEDWRSLSEAEQRERLADFLEADRRRGFDPGQAPLFRAALFRLAESTFDFVWSAHHLLLDGWSMSVLFNELFAAYGDLRAGRAPHLVPALPYRDYIEWIERQDRAECEGYWRRTLAGLARPTLLANRGGSAMAEESGQATASLELSDAVTADLAAFAQQHQITQSTLMQGALALLIGHQLRSEDVVFGLTLAGRPAELSQVEHRIGLFSNTLLLRVRLDPSEQVLSWLQRIQDDRLDGSRFEYSPLVDVQTWSGLPSGSQLFDTILTYQNFPLDSVLDERDLGVRILRAEEKAQNSNPMTFLAVPGRRFALTLLYDRRSVSTARAEALLRQLSVLLRELTARPGHPIADLQSLLREQAREDEAIQAQSFNQAMRDRLKKRERPDPRA